MKAYKLSILPMFERDLTEAAAYISEVLKNPAAAERLVTETEEAIHKRLLSPLSFEAFNSAKQRKDTYYRIFVGNYSVFYVVIGDVMEVRRFIYSRRDIDRIL